ncbi:MAG TPA: protein translocase subunit SecF [Acidimicrobiia bacterium]|nr:protein translocase subunit SecF [Acidimicrobiia bacterium]
MVLHQGGLPMSAWNDLLHGTTRIDFVGRLQTWLKISAIALLVSVVAILVRDLNLGIEFRGGVSITTANPAGASVEDVRALTDGVGVAQAVIQIIDNGEAMRVQTPALSDDAQQSLVDLIASTTGSNPDDISIDSVGPTFGALILRQSIIALVVFLGVVMLFITWRLEWKMAATGIVALIHDLIITAGFYGITGFEVTPATVVAALTILGYSLYDTVVVFDKIEEQERAAGERSTISDIVNRSTNLVLSRSLLTALTSLLPVGSILFVGAFIFGATSLRDFALALFVGIAIGTYSSVFLASPLLAVWKEGEDEWISRRRRLESKTRASSTVVSETPATTESAPTPKRPTSATPRPPKKRKR